MNVAILTTHLPPVMGGIEVHCDELSRALVGRGHQVTLYGSLEPDQPDELRESPPGANPRIRRVPALFAPGLRRPTRLANLWRRVWDDHRARPFDVLHAHQIYPVGLSAAGLSAALGIRLVITEHGSILDDARSPWKRPLIRRAGDRAAAVLTASGELADAVISAGLPRSAVRALPNAIFPERFRADGDRGPDGHRAARRRALGLDADAFVAMTVRRLVPKTGVQYAVRALPRCLDRLPNLHLVVVGDGPLRPQIEESARALGVAERVSFVGMVDNTRVPQYMRAADVGLFPSLAEATSIAALEFMASGTPVVASSVGGLPEIVEDGVTGFLFDLGFTRSRYDDPGLPEDAVQNLADAIHRAARADLSAMGRRAAARVRERYSWSAYVARLEREIYAS